MAEPNVVYVTSYKFMLGSNTDQKKTVLPFQEEEKVKDAITHVPVYLYAKPLNDHPKLGKEETLRTSRIVKMENNNGIWKVRTSSGTCYLLLPKK